MRPLRRRIRHLERKVKKLEQLVSFFLTDEADTQHFAPPEASSRNQKEKKIPSADFSNFELQQTTTRSWEDLPSGVFRHLLEYTTLSSCDALGWLRMMGVCHAWRQMVLKECSWIDLGFFLRNSPKHAAQLKLQFPEAMIPEMMQSDRLQRYEWLLRGNEKDDLNYLSGLRCLDLLPLRSDEVLRNFPEPSSHFFLRVVALRMHLKISFWDFDSPRQLRWFHAAPCKYQQSIFPVTDKKEFFERLAQYNRETLYFLALPNVNLLPDAFLSLIQFKRLVALDLCEAIAFFYPYDHPPLTSHSLENHRHLTDDDPRPPLDRQSQLFRNAELMIWVLRGLSALRHLRIPSPYGLVNRPNGHEPRYTLTLWRAHVFSSFPVLHIHVDDTSLPPIWKFPSEHSDRRWLFVPVHQVSRLLSPLLLMNSQRQSSSSE